jgi:hypothetical protein
MQLLFQEPHGQASSVTGGIMSINMLNRTSGSKVAYEQELRNDEDALNGSKAIMLK